MISQSTFTRLLREFVNSPEGKKYLKEKYGIIYDEKFTNKVKRSCAEKLKEILLRHITTLIDSITEDDIVIGDFYRTDDGKTAINLTFRDGSLHRESLRPDLYPEGLENIVLLFKEGYTASNSLHGTWLHNGMELEVWSKVHRDSSEFLNEAINEFNTQMGGKAVATLKNKYE